MSCWRQGRESQVRAPALGRAGGPAGRRCWQVHVGNVVYLIPELTDEEMAAVDVHDGSVEEWQDLMGPPTLTIRDFLHETWLPRSASTSASGSPGTAGPAGSTWPWSASTMSTGTTTTASTRPLLTSCTWMTRTAASAWPSTGTTAAATTTGPWRRPSTTRISCAPTAPPGVPGDRRDSRWQPSPAHRSSRPVPDLVVRRAPLGRCRRCALQRDTDGYRHRTVRDRLRRPRLRRPAGVGAFRAVRGAHHRVPPDLTTGDADGPQTHRYLTLPVQFNGLPTADGFVDGLLVPAERRGTPAAAEADLESVSWARIKAALAPRPASRRVPVGEPP